MPRNKPQESYTCIAPKETGDRIGLCGRPSIGKSLCSTHLKRVQRNGTLARRRAPAGFYTPCQHPDGCPEPRSRNGWCQRHANRIRVYGDPGPAGEWVEEVTATPDCKHPDGCSRPAWCAGWCSLHYNRIYKTGDPGPVESRRKFRDPGTCQHPLNCPRVVYAKGWCRLHYARVTKGSGKPGPVGAYKGQAKA